MLVTLQSCEAARSPNTATALRSSERASEPATEAATVCAPVKCFHATARSLSARVQPWTVDCVQTKQQQPQQPQYHHRRHHHHRQHYYYYYYYHYTRSDAGGLRGRHIAAKPVGSGWVVHWLVGKKRRWALNATHTARTHDNERTGRLYVRMDGWTDGRMDGWMDAPIYLFLFV